MCFGVFDVFGCQSFEVIEGVDYIEQVDLVIKVLGFELEELLKLWGVDGFEVICWGMIKVVFGIGQISFDGVFVVGDIVCGVLLVVWVICDGCESVVVIFDYLNQLVNVVVE